MLELLEGEVMIVLENIAECDVHLECFGCLSLLVGQEQGYWTRDRLMKRWGGFVVGELPYKKEYFPYYLLLLELAYKPEY